MYFATTSFTARSIFSCRETCSCKIKDGVLFNLVRSSSDGLSTILLGGLLHCDGKKVVIISPSHCIGITLPWTIIRNYRISSQQPRKNLFSGGGGGEGWKFVFVSCCTAG